MIKMESGRICRNCGVKAIDELDLCIICLAKKQCKWCRRRLDEHCFADSGICFGCTSKRRSAVGETFVDTEMPTSTALTFEEYFLQNKDAIRDVISDALKNHR